MTKTLEYADTLADTVDIASRRMGISRRQLYREISGGRLIVCKVGKRTLVERTEQSRWLASCRVEKATSADFDARLLAMTSDQLQDVVDGLAHVQPPTSN